TTSARDALNEDFVSLRDQITSVVSNAAFNGANLLDDSMATATTAFKALANVSGGSISVKGEDMSLGGSAVTLGASASIATASEASSAIATIDTSIANVSASLARLGTSSKALGTHLTFVGKLQD